MPITPFHLGPSSWIGLTLFKILDFPAFIVGSVIVDLEPFFIIIFNLGPPFHRFFHTILGGSLAAILTAIVLYILRTETKKIMAVFKLVQNSSFKKILFSSFAGVYFHVLLDSFLNNEVKPFYPFENNPFLRLVSTKQMYIFSGLSFLVGILIYLIRLKLLKKNLKSNS